MDGMMNRKIYVYGDFLQFIFSFFGKQTATVEKMKELEEADCEWRKKGLWHYKWPQCVDLI